ncbi:MAG: restriction endonuclease subunit S, partial [Methanobrevibacter sp.]|nr:restriction endonuclease subunit S [Methanobrevibacter sp.]
EGINWDECGYISKERFDESPEIILKDKDILISKDGTIGKLGYVKNLDMDSTVASGIFVVRNQNEDYIDTDFLYYYFRSPFFKWFIKSVTEGSVIPHLYQRDFTDMEFNLFELDTQKKCSYILNAIEEKINVNRKININFIEINLSLVCKCIFCLFLFIIKKYFIFTDFELNYVKLICMQYLLFYLTNLMDKMSLKNFYFKRDLLVMLILKIVIMLM